MADMYPILIDRMREKERKKKRRKEKRNKERKTKRKKERMKEREKEKKEAKEKERESCSWVLFWSWAVQLPAVLQKNPPAPAHSLVFQNLLHIWTLSNSDCMILRFIFSHGGQWRDKYTAITKGGNIYWCSRRQHNAWRARARKHLNSMCSFVLFCLKIIYKHMYLYIYFFFFGTALKKLQTFLNVSQKTK